MRKLESVSCACPYSTSMLLHTTWIIYSVGVHIFSNVEGGLLEIQKLPLCGITNKPRSTKTTLVLYVNDFGAKGDGFTDDTQILSLWENQDKLICAYLFSWLAVLSSRTICAYGRDSRYERLDFASLFLSLFSSFLQALEDIWKIACSSSSKSKIVIPAQYSVLVRPIQFAGRCRSKVTITILGSILAPKSPDVWDGLNKQKWLYFINVKNLIIEGHGVVNGMGREWWLRSCKVNTTYPCQHAPTAMTFHKCENLKVRNLIVIDSQQMHMAFTSCVKVVASRLRVSAPAASPNTDGIHISASTHVEVKDTIIHTGDDCISIVSNSSRIHVRNITCGPGHGISIGSLGKSNTWSQVHNVRVEGAHFLNTQNGVRIKTWQGGSGFASQITFKDLWMENVSNPIIIDQYYCDSRLPCRNQTSALQVKNISYIRVKGTSATENAIRFACSDNYPCKGLYLEDIQLVPESGGILNSFCWEAKGSSSGEIYPPPCFSCEGSIIDQRVRSYSVLKSI